MKKTKIVLTTILLAASTWLAKGQSCSSSSCSIPACEYVCNGGFDYKSSTPTALNQLNLACGWTNTITAYTPDYYHSASTTGSVGIPCNINGNQSSQFDDGYVGLLGQAGYGWHEAIATSLKTNLNGGSLYEVSFYLSLADVSSYNALNSFGIEFVGGGGPYYVNTSSVTTTGWTKISYIYGPAGSGEIGLKIGFLKAVSLSDLVAASSSGVDCYGNIQAGPYYYLDNVSVREINQIDVSSSHITGCTGESFTLTASNANTYTYTPSVGSPTVGNPLVVTPGSSTTYTVTGTNSGGCVMTPTTITIAPYTCCANPAANNITLRDVNIVTYSASPPAGVLQWSSLTSGGFYTGTICAPALVSGVSKITNTLTIVNTLSISTPVTFSNCNVVICEDDIIKQYSTTTIDHSLLKGDATTLWKGIESSAKISVTNSWIEDAYIALIFSGTNHPGVNIDNVLFNKNYVGVAGFVGTMNPSDLLVTGCVFSSRSFGTPNYTTTTRYSSLFPNIPANAGGKIKGSTVNSITYNTIRSHIGLYLYALTSNTTTNYFSIGAVTTGTPPNSDLTNYFDYLNCGIYNYESKASIINNQFANMITTGTGTALGAVVHVDASNPSVTKTEVGRSGSSNYRNFFGYPVYSSSMLDGVVATGGGTLNVSYNEFRTFSRYGVSVKSWYAGTAANEPVTVAYNSYTNTAYAFYGYDNNSIEATVSTNTLVHTASTYTAYTNVFLDEINKPTTAVYHIYNNNFTGSLKGVYALNTRGTRIINNDITINKPGTGVYNADITLDNSDYCVVAQNTVDCSPTNSSSWYTMGILSSGSANNTYKCNIISKVGNCLKFQYTCPSSTILKNTLNNTGGTDPCAVGIVVQSCPSFNHIGFPTGGGYGHSDDVWGDFSTADTYCSANSNTATPTANIYYDGSATASLYQPQVNIKDVFPDISIVFAPTTTTTANTDPCNEGARMMNVSGGGKGVKGSIGEFESGSSVYNSNSETMTNYQATDLSKGRKRILMYNDNKSDQRSGTNNENRFYEVDSLLMLYAQTKDISALNAARSINSAIAPNGKIQQNQKDFNAIHAVYIEDDSLVSSTQIQELINLAYLCPETDGLSVYQARGLIRNWDDSTDYFNECERTLPEIATNPEAAQRLLADTKNNPVSVKQINLYPNPSNGKLIVENTLENSTFELYDIVGRKVYTSSLSGNATQLDISSFNNGTYLYKIIQNGKPVKEDKLILNK